MNRYIPVTAEDRRRMLGVIGAASVDDLFSGIPVQVRQKKASDLPKALSEPEMLRDLRALSGKNLNADDAICFLGAGVYDHFIPSAVDSIVSRGEFTTSYTPYQPEVAQGTRLRVVVHVGSNCLADAITLAAQAQQLGAVAIAALAPSYYKPRSLETLTRCLGEIAAAAPATPFYFYDIPALTGVDFSMPEFLAHAHGRIPTLAGIKFTNSDLMAYQLCLRFQAGALDIPYGCDEYLLAALALGAKGAVGSSYNFAAPIYQRLFAAFQRGDLAAAREEQFRSVLLIQTLARIGYLGAAKAVMDMLGVPVGPARLPNNNPTAEQLVALRSKLEAMSFFDWIKA